MIHLDHQFLAEIGLGELPVETQRRLLGSFLELLQIAVGSALFERMSDEQIAEFEVLIEAGDEAAALAWLEQVHPDYKQVVAAEFQRLRSELAASAPDILATGGISAAPPPGLR